MSCTSPIYAFIEGKTESGKNKLHFCTPKTGDFGDVRALKRKYRDKLVALPCGHCLSCKLDYAKQWATRCVLESLNHQRSSFITLTYNDAFLPDKPVKSDFQKFLKRLRKAHPDIEIRYFGCGERGTESAKHSEDGKGRPHYHLIIFGYDFPDRVAVTSSLAESKELQRLWPFGISSVGDVTIESCSYVARYTSKKFGGDGDEFILMSRRPGLGESYYQNHADLMFITDAIYGKFGKTHKVKIPRYFMKLAEVDGRDLVDVKNKRIERANNYMDLASYLHQCGDDIALNKIINEQVTIRFSMLRRGIC